MREIALVYTDLGALLPLKKGGMEERYRCFSLPLCASVIQGKRLMVQRPTDPKAGNP